MQRVIYEVYAKVVDANGSYNTLTGYPKVFDSRSYNGDLAKTLQRAEGEFYDTVGAMCKIDTRQQQAVMLFESDGTMLMRKSIGRIADLPDAEGEE